jgi:ribosomal protein S15P/S13E
MLNNTEEQTDTTTVETEQTSSTEIDVGALTSRLEALEAENTKLRQIKKAVTKERDEFKKANQTTQSEDYRELYEQETQRYNKLQEHLKNNAIDAALRESLKRLKIQDTALDAAVKLVDKNLITWDEEDGVDTIGLDAASKKLKSQHSFLFEKPVGATDNFKVPGKTSQIDKSISRSAFFALSPKEQGAKSLAGWTVYDD